METTKVAWYLPALVLALASCYVGNPELDADPGPENPIVDPSLSAPSWVVAEYSLTADSTGVVRVSWEESAYGYALYRRLGAGAWKPIAGDLAAASFDDYRFYEDLDDPSVPKAVQYAVRTVSGVKQSVLSTPSAATAPVVLGLRASMFAATNGIPLTWDAHPSAESYRVYRSERSDPAEADLERAATVIASASETVCWTDAASGGKPAPSVMYFYLVTWVDDGKEYGKADGLRAPGAYYSVIDHYEPNEEWASLIGKPTSLFVASQPPLIYEIDDGHGSVLKDTDWYVYNAERGVQFTVRVTLSDATPFADDELVFRFYYAGAYGPRQYIQKGMANEFSFAPPGTGSKVPVYFGVSTDLNTTRSVIGSYSVAVVTEL